MDKNEQEIDAFLAKKYSNWTIITKGVPSFLSDIKVHQQQSNLAHTIYMKRINITCVIIPLLLINLIHERIFAQEPTAMAKAEWIQSPVIQFGILRAPVIFQKDFKITKAVKSARLLITSHGIYEGKLNGRRIGQDYFMPGHTNYEQKLQYQIYNIAPYLLNGENLIEITIGDGWWRGFVNGKQNQYGSDLGLLCALEITFQDRSKMIINSDESWKYGSGPLRYADLQMGEKSDGNRLTKMEGQARIFLASRHHLIPTTGATTQKQEVLKAVKITGDSLYDFGKEISGWIRFVVKGDQGDSIVVKHTKLLTDRGDLLQTPDQANWAVDSYILRGGTVENYEPHFTIHDFRYAKMTIYRNGQKVNRLVKPFDIKAINVNIDLKVSDQNQKARL